MPSKRAALVRRVFVAALRAQRHRSREPFPDAPDEELEAYALRLRAQMEGLSRFVRLSPHVDWQPTTTTPVAGEWVAASWAAPDRVVLHLHGGGYVMGSPRTHRGMAASLSRVAKSRVLVPDYRLAPEHPFPAALDDAVATYRWLVEVHGIAPARIAVTGDSAGGGLAVASLVRLRDEGVALPACAALLSPWTDLAGTGESMSLMDGTDPWLSSASVPPAARAYASTTPLDHPLVSPHYADLTGLPPLLVQVGTDEILFDDARRLVDGARAADVDASLGVYEGLWHVFQAFPGLPESRRALREIGAFVRRHTDRAHPPSTPPPLSAASRSPLEGGA